MNASTSSLNSPVNILISIVLMVCSTLPYFAVFLADKATYRYRRAELERAVCTVHIVRNRLIPEEIRKALTDELSLFFDLRNYAVGLSMNAVVSVLLTFVALIKAQMINWPTPLNSTIALFPKAALAAALGAYVANVAALAEKARFRELSSYTFQLSWVKTIASAAVGALIGISVKEGFDIWVAFGIGVLPVQVLLDVAADKAARALAANAREKKESRPQDLHLLYGMTESVISKFNDQGITCVQQLAFASPIKLLARTNLEWTAILDFIDQALLYNYILDNISKAPRLGIRGSIEMGTLMDELSSTNPAVVQAANAVVGELALAMKLDKDSTIYTIKTIYEDMTVRNLAMLFGSILGGSENSALVAKAQTASS